MTHDTGASATDRITNNGSVTLSGTMSGASGTIVQVFDGTTALGTATLSGSNWSYTTTLAAGTHTLHAVATDLAGNTATTAAQPTVTVDTTAPVVTGITASIASGATLVGGQTFTLTVTTSEPVTVSTSGGAPTLTLSDGGTATYDAAHSTATALVFDAVVAGNQTSTDLLVSGLALNGGNISDLAGNALTLTSVTQPSGHNTGLIVNPSTPATSGAGTVTIVSSSQSVVTGTSGQNTFKLIAGTSNSDTSITNFDTGTAGDTLLLAGAGTYNIADYHLDDILWDNGSYAPVMWELNGNSVIGGGVVAGSPGTLVMPGYHIGGVGDFNGDGRSDILWLSNVPSATAAIGFWFMDGTGVQGALLNVGAVSSKVWIGDFNGDGKSDILFDYGSGAPVLYEMNGAQLINASFVAGGYNTVVMPGYHIAGVGDFDGDGKSDILWVANTPGAEAGIWFMNGPSVRGALVQDGPTPTTAWIGDFNGDGKSDILWDNGSYAPYLWEMDGSQVIGGGFIGGAAGTLVMPGYHIAGVGDFNGDGKTDILWAANTPGAPAGIWFMNGTSIEGAALSYGATPTTAFIGDFNLDGAQVDYGANSSVVLDNVDQHTSTIDFQTSTVVGNITTIVNGVSTNTGPSGTLSMAANHTQLWLQMSGNDLDIDILGSAQQTVIKNWGSPVTTSWEQLAQITATGDNLKLDTQIDGLIQAMATFSASNPGFNPLTTANTSLSDAAYASLANGAAYKSWHS